MSHPQRVLFVCLGNICRSPMAEGIFRHHARLLGLSIEFDSCGTGGWHAGESPDPRAQQCIQSHGMSIADLRARQFRISDFDAFDLIYTMDLENHQNVVRLARTESDRTKVRMVLGELNPHQPLSVPDPYYGDGDGFERVFDMLERSALKAFERWKNEQS